jgi:hypothetical protein
MITVYPVQCDSAVVYSAVELLGARKYVYHCLLAIVDVGERVVTRRGEKGILNSEAIG